MPILLLVFVLALGGNVWAATVDSLAMFRVDSVEIEVRDAFDDAPSHTAYDAWLYDLGNTLHIETRKSVVGKLLLFQKGDSVSLYQLIESERLLRNQKYLSDARIEKRTGSQGENILRVVTSDNWTTSPILALNKPGNEWIWQAGIIENNFLGFGQSIGFFVAHDELRDQKFFEYKNPHFLWARNSMQAMWSENSDGYFRSVRIAYPYLSRSRNQWAYTVEAMSEKRDQIYYWSGDEVPGSAAYDTTGKGFGGKSISVNDGTNPNRVVGVKGLHEDSVSLRLGRSFGGSSLKQYVRASWDWHREGHYGDRVVRYTYVQDGEIRAVDSASAANDWVPRSGDSRLGLAWTLSRIRYDRLVNYHRVKWTEDVDRGYQLQVEGARNVEQLGADDDRWRFLYDIYMAFGGSLHHLTMRSFSQFYVDGGEREDIYSLLQGEYMFKPAQSLAMVFTGKFDSWRNAPLGRQLTLGGIAGMPGFASNLQAGQARMLFRLEQRWFPGWELGTVLPVFTVFGDAGQVQSAMDSFAKDDMQYVVGLGMRLSMSKSIDGVVNHVNVSWPVNGPLRNGWVPRFSVLGLLSL